MTDQPSIEVFRKSTAEMFERMGIKHIVIVDDQYAENQPGVEDLIGLCTVIGAKKASKLLLKDGIAETDNIEVLSEMLKAKWKNLEAAKQQLLLQKMQVAISDPVEVVAQESAALAEPSASDQEITVEPPSEVEKTDKLVEAPVDMNTFADKLFEQAEHGVEVAVADDNSAAAALTELFENIQDCTFTTFSLTQWNENGERLLHDGNTRNTLFLFDRDFSKEQASVNAGFRLIQQAQAVPEVICGMLTHTVEAKGEYRAWEQLSAEHNIDSNRFILISKSRLISQKHDLAGFIAMLRLTALRGRCMAIKDEAWGLFNASMAEAKKEIEKLSVYDFDQVVLASSRHEGVWEPETLFRIFAIFMMMQAREKMYGSTKLAALVDKARHCSVVANEDDELEDAFGRAKQGWRIQQYEMYEPGKFVNTYNLPIDTGDIFEDGTRKYILLAQPCDLMVREDGKRSYDDKDSKCALLVELVKPNADRGEKDRFAEIQMFDENSGTSAFLDFSKIHNIRLSVLDLCAFNTDGAAKIDIDATCPVRLIDSWQKRYVILQKEYRRVVERYDRFIHLKNVTNEIKALALPIASNTGRFSGQVDGTCVRFDLHRVRRHKQPYSGVLLTRLLQFHSRAAFEHRLGSPGKTSECSEEDAGPSENMTKIPAIAPVTIPQPKRIMMTTRPPFAVCFIIVQFCRMFQRWMQKFF